MVGRVRLEGPPEFGVTGGLTKLKPRADFRVEDFERMIDAQGARLAWARAIRCPCVPVNAQTQQPDPRCERCRRHPGWTFFGPADYFVPAAVGQLDQLQQAVVEHYGASVIRGIMVGLNHRDDEFNKLGIWRFGEGLVTVRPQNVLAYNDRLVDLDSEIAFSEVLEVTYQQNQVVQPTTRYPVLALNHALDNRGVTYRQGADLILSPKGELRWRSGHAPVAKTRVTLSYLCHAHWRVMDQPHVMRRTQVLTKTKQPTTPLGTPRALPIQAQIKLEQMTEEP